MSLWAGKQAGENQILAMFMPDSVNLSAVFPSKDHKDKMKFKINL